jgi:hypothetical protein
LTRSRLLTSFVRRSEDPTVDKTDEDAVLIARLSAHRPVPETRSSAGPRDQGQMSEFPLGEGGTMD